MKLLFTIAAFAVALGVLIVIHELGHYWVARLCNVKVLRFSVGFGKPLFTLRRGRDGTEWVLAAFPLGGYVKMADEREGEVAPEDLPRAFNRQTVWTRIGIVAAGPAANFLLAILLYWGLFMHGMQGLKPLLAQPPAGTPAAIAGLQEGDRVARVNGEAVATWNELRWLLLKRAVDKATVTLEVVSQRGALSWPRIDLSDAGADEVDSDFVRKVGLVPYQPPVKPVIGRVLEGAAAARAGLEEGDEVLAVNGAAVAAWDEFVRWVRQSPGRTLALELRRGTRELRVEVVPEAVQEGGERVGKIGVSPRVDRAALQQLVVQVSYAPLPALERALDRTWDTSVFSLQVLYKMVIGEVSWRNVSGPITIADYAGQSAQLGWVYYLVFLASISVSLGVLNLLPIPLLDGGHLMYYMAELVKGKPLSDKAMEIGQQVGIALLFTLMAFAIYNDITRLISG